mmetsp:Transcript_11330/g.26867  ORF Transcript_11330/g.26867 Transcript_11330/m.26867 type:complete len:337 (-) Transcript_11330:2567-3577(-)
MHPPLSRSQVQRRPQVVIPDVGADSVFNKQLHSLQLTVVCKLAQLRAGLLVLRERCPLSVEKLCQGMVLVLHGLGERGHPMHVRNRHVRLHLAHEPCHDLRVAPRRRDVEGCPLEKVGLVHVKHVELDKVLELDKVPGGGEAYHLHDPLLPFPALLVLHVALNLHEVLGGVAASLVLVFSRLVLQLHLLVLELGLVRGKDPLHDPLLLLWIELGEFREGLLGKVIEDCALGVELAPRAVRLRHPKEEAELPDKLPAAGCVNHLHVADVPCKELDLALRNQEQLVDDFIVVEHVALTGQRRLLQNDAESIDEVAAAVCEHGRLLDEPPDGVACHFDL